MAVYSKEHRYLFIMAPRTACTATGIVLVKQVDGKWLPRRDKYDEDGNLIVERKHSTLDDLLRHGVMGPGRANRTFKFTTVRNPFDSLVSLYVKKRTSYQALLDDEDAFVHNRPGFVEDMQYALNHSFSAWVIRNYGPRAAVRSGRHLYARFINGMDYVMRFERLQEDFDEALRRVGIDRRVEIPMINPTDEREPDYREYYDRKARFVVERAFRGDLERFGYRF